MNRVMACPDVQAHYRLLAEACRSVASYQLRTRATIVGNICNASPPATRSAPAWLDGVLNVHGVDGFREVSLAGFFLGPGKTVLKPGDIVTALRFPLPSERQRRGLISSSGRNTWSDLSIVGVTALGYPAAGDPSGYRFRLALASVAPVPLAVTAAQEYLAENAPGPETFTAGCPAGCSRPAPDRRCARQRPLPQGDGHAADGEGAERSPGNGIKR